MLTGYDCFRLFADESLACAREATTAKWQVHHLAMADMWIRAAAKQQRDDNERALGLKRISLHDSSE